MILMMLLAATAAPHEVPLAKTALMGVRVQVFETCTIGPSAIQCRGAAPSVTPHVTVGADGVRTIEF